MKKYYVYTSLTDGFHVYCNYVQVTENVIVFYSENGEV